MSVMEAIAIKEQLHQYIENGDERLLRLMYALVKEYNDEDEPDFEFNEDDLKQFDERRQSRLSGASRTYTWDETKAIVTAKKNVE